MLRVWRLFPPRKCRGAHSSSVTAAPFSRAVMAALSAAAPPPITNTSVSLWMPDVILYSGRLVFGYCDIWCLIISVFGCFDVYLCAAFQQPAKAQSGAP